MVRPKIQRTRRLTGLLHLLDQFCQKMGMNWSIQSFFFFYNPIRKTKSVRFCNFVNIVKITYIPSLKHFLLFVLEGIFINFKIRLRGERKHNSSSNLSSASISFLTGPFAPPHLLPTTKIPSLFLSLVKIT